MVFDHEKLHVYQSALNFIEWTEVFFESNTKKKISVLDQLERASTSIALNIAEGNGKFTTNDKCRFFDIARGSAFECASCLDVLVKRKYIAEVDANSGKKILFEIVSMLMGLLKKNDNRVYEEQILYTPNE